MEENCSRRNFLKKSAGTLGGLLFLEGCSDNDKVIFDGEIEGQRVVYYNNCGFWGSDKMEIYSGGKLSKIMIDWDERGSVGDNEYDRYIVITNGDKRITYAKNFVIDENGIRFTAGSDFSEKIFEVGKQRLEEATKLYQDLKEKIGQELGSKL